MAIAKQIVRRVVPDSLSNDLQSLHPLLQRIYASRGVSSLDMLDRGLENLLPFSSLKDIDRAVDCLSKAIEADKKIMIIGDYDADGATSTAVAVRALQLFGSKKVAYVVPSRFDFGYGLTPEVVKLAAECQPDVIITVDNGIASHDGVIAAHERGIQVIITDHHLPGDTLPEADAIVNPNQHGCEFPSKSLAGCGVIFYVMLALRAALRERGWFEKKSIPDPNMGQLLDLVALGTVADLVPLCRNNRILVYQGLRRIRAGQASSGVIALMQVAKCAMSTVVASNLGFLIAPRLNAAGRLDDMSVGVACLLSNDLKTAIPLAQQLDSLNRERRQIESGMQIQADAILTKQMQGWQSNTLPSGFCLYDPSWHQGVVGILAARVKEHWHRPVIAFAKADMHTLKGSARSIPGLHMRDLLANIDVAHPGMMTKFGGHAMAAGLTLSLNRFEDFHQAFLKAVEREVDEKSLAAKIVSDGEVPSSSMQLDFAELLRESGPWGQQFAEPLFDGVFEVLQQRVLADKHLKLVLKTSSEQDIRVDAVAFNVDAFSADRAQWPTPGTRIRIAYRMDINEFNQQRRLQLIIEHLEFA